MSKCSFSVILAIVVLTFTLLIQCKVKSGVERVESNTEISKPEISPRSRPETTRKPSPPPRRPIAPSEQEPKKSFETQSFAEREDVRNSEMINSEKNSFSPSAISAVKVPSSHPVKEISIGSPMNNDNVGVKATLGISYFKSIRQFETKDLRVSAIFNGDANLVRKKIRDIEAIEYEFVPKEDSSTIRVIKDITLFKKLKIALHYDKADFTVTAVPEDAEDEQELDFTEGNNWHWTLRAVAEKPHPAIVKVEIFGEDYKGSFKLIALKEVEIKIDITESETFWSKAVKWPGDNLDYIIEGMLVPLIIYLWKRRKKILVKNS
jgi:hypothetical protein